MTPNETLQQTGHATDDCSGFGGPSRVSRLLSVALAASGSPMGRLRFTRQQAQNEAARRASEFLSGLPSCTGFRLQGTHPDTTVARSHNSKHPVAWLVVFRLDQPDGGVMDGGELFVAVDLESGAVAIRD
jgi:hypothetical protein